MANSWHQPSRTSRTTTASNFHHTHVAGCVTTVDIARHQKFHTTSIAGVKRNSTEIHDAVTFAQPLQHDTFRPPVLAVPRSVVPNKLSASTITRVRRDDDGSLVPSPQDEIRPRSTPGPSQHPLLSLSHPRYGLPGQLIANLEKLGVKSIYPWQSSCLLGRGLLEGRQNLIYTAPTGGGKSLVADILMLKRVIENPDQKALLVLPYVALVQEKTRWLRRAVESVQKKIEADEVQPRQTSRWSLPNHDVRVTAFFGGSKSKVTWADCDVAVCTIEKANSLVNTAIEDGNIDQLGTVVVDELHMLDDEHRGYISELMITKLLCLQTGIQVVGMSATLPNPKLLADWMQAKFYVSKHRPIPIEEHLVYDNQIYPTASSKDFLWTASQLTSLELTQKPPNPSHVISVSSHQELKNPVTNAVVALAVETAIAGYGALVFCSSRQGSQVIATLISDAVPSEVSTEVTNMRLDVLASLQALSGGYETAFSKTIPAGVGFHHAGLTIEEREIIAEAYDMGALKIMVATCSLAAGINLPARRVILHGAKMGRDFVGPAMLRQMRGRAGRKGKDEIGETFLCCQKEELETVAELLEAELPAVVSCLTPDKRGLKRAILEVIATRLASSYDSLQDYVSRSLLWQTSDHAMILQMLETALSSLVQDELIQLMTDNAYIPTRLGVAVVASSLTPEDGLFVHADLRRALTSFVMDSELHIFYLFTPIPQPSPSMSLTFEVSWPVFRTLLDTLDEPSLRALRSIGISPALVNKMANSGLSDLKETTPQEVTTARIYRRMYSTFALRDLCNEIPIHTISLKYNLPRGTIQSLARTCHGFAAGMIKFCQRMSTPLPTHLNLNPQVSSSSPTLDPNSSGFSMLSAVLEHMQDRLSASARPDLLQMTQVPFVKGRMARLLYESGFKGIRALAEADPKRDILPIMMGVSGWKSRARPGEARDDYEQRKKKVEEKVLRKAEVLVGGAGRIWEKEVLSGAFDEE